MKPGILLSFLITWLLVDLLCAEDDQPASNENYNFKVQISGLSVTIVCPNDGDTTLTKGIFKSAKTVEHLLTDFSPSSNGIYECEKKYLYLNAYVCETCTDVSMTTVALILIGDCMVTLVVSLIVYFGCRRKSGHTRQGRFANGGHKRGNTEHPPPVPDPDYQPLQKGRRDIYDGLNRNF